MEKKIAQPSRVSIKQAALLFQGPIVTKRVFQQCAPRMVRSVSEIEFQDVLKELESSQCGKVVRAHVTKSRSQVVFLKARPVCESIKNLAFIEWEEYERKLKLPCNTGISQSLKRYLIERNVVSEDFFSN